MHTTFQPTEKFWLWLVALAGLIGPNGVFLFYALFRTEVFAAALSNPVALVFMIDALIAVAILAYLFARSGAGRLHWGWFVVLSLIGGLVFSIPAFLLLSSGSKSSGVAGTG